MALARDIMTEDPITLRPNAKVREAVRLLQSMEIRHLPVVDEEQGLVGMLSDRDLRGVSLPHLIDERWFGDLRMAMEEAVSTVMSSDVLSVDMETEARDIIELMLEHKVGAVPVVDADGGLVGIVSYMDVLRELAVFVE
ncbi:MAG: CBS domain-containing protein [Polyangiales bacterium]